MTWTPDRIGKLTQLWLEGLSARQIAARLGDVSRNAVIGKVHRLGLSGQGAPARRRPPSGRPRTRATAQTPAPVVATPQPPRSLTVEEPSPESKITILQLSDHVCRWPVGDPRTPNFRFCGTHLNDTKDAYCGYHTRIAYQRGSEPKTGERGERVLGRSGAASA